MKMIKITPLLITVLLAVNAGNTWLQVYMQKDVVSLSRELEKQLTLSAEKSVQMNTQLDAIAELKKKSLALSKKVEHVESNTAGLDKELKELDRIVAAISERVNAIGENAGATYQELKRMEESILSSIQILHSLETSNKQVVQILTRMKSLQAEINANLRQMNEKTKYLPETAGGGDSP